MSTYDQVILLGAHDRPGRTVHLVRRHPSRYWKGQTWCGRRGEPAVPPIPIGKRPLCRDCLKRAA